jgi:hypothetical protein
VLPLVPLREPLSVLQQEPLLPEQRVLRAVLLQQSVWV